MRQKELLDSIKKHLARFEAQVKISNLNNEYDINIHAENVIVPLLNLIYSTDLKNANYSEGKNTEAIDLIDKKTQIAIQVTATTKIDKVKKTLSKFLSSKYSSGINKLYIYMLREKQGFYTQAIFDKITGAQFTFIAKSDIIDSADIYRKVYETNDINIIEKVEFLLRNQFSDVYITSSFTLNQLENFKEAYTKSCIANFSRINFFGLSVNSNRPREIELYLLFVSPRFSIKENMVTHFVPHHEYLISTEFTESRFIETQPFISYKEKDIMNIELERYFNVKKVVTLEDNESRKSFPNFFFDLKAKSEIEFSELFSHPHIVVIGSPGAGKSSFIKYSLCKILEGDKSIFENKDIYECIPFRIELHKYNKYKKNNTGGIIQYLHELLKSEYQYDLAIEKINSILKTFPTLFLFDGLDEIFDIQDRLSVRNDIETFLLLHSKTRSIVTSRHESYEEVNLSNEMFTKYELLNFDDNQVKDYAIKWYNIEEKDSLIRQRELENCLIQLNTVDPELKFNPLLLSLILLLYRNELDIPTSKLNIYESCTNTIVETRDVKEKKLDITLKIGNKIAIFASLAFWKFDNESKRLSAPAFEDVRNFVTNYLLEKGEFNQENLARQATDEFLEFAKVRSIFFENKFTHKTFLEYFTAYYIYSFFYNNRKKAEEFDNLISNYLGLSAWSVVLELLICKIDTTQINYEVIDDLIDIQFKKSKIDALIFFLQILKYLKNISPKKIRFLIDQSIEACFDETGKTIEGKIDHKEVLFGHLSALGKLERFSVVIEVAFTELIKNGNAEVLNLNIFAYEFAITSGSTLLVEILQNKNLESNTEYVFILKHYPNLFDNGRYLESLKLFIQTFTASKTQNTYKSAFNQKIFFNSTKFNWNISYLSKNIQDSPINLIWAELVHLGIPKATLANSVNDKLDSFNLVELKQKLNSATGKDSLFKKFISKLKEIYLEKKHIKPVPNLTFYDTYYKNKKKRK